MSATTSPTRRGARLDELELGAWRGFLRVHAALSRQLDAELTAAHGLPLSAYEVLLFLADAPGGQMRMSDLADSVLLSRSGLTRLVDRLERDGLVRRRACPGDTRGFNAVITDAGASASRRPQGTHLDGVRRRFLDRLSDEEKVAPGRVWERMRQADAARPADPTASAQGRGHARAVAPPHLAQGAGQPADALLELVGLEEREGQPQAGALVALGGDRAARRERHAVAHRLGVQRRAPRRGA